MTINKQRRHGDVFMTEIDSLPEGLVEAKHNRVAEGEVTGHSHRLVGDAKLFTRGTGASMEMFFSVGEKGASIIHQEHKTITFTPNTVHSVRIQREWAVEGERRVAD
jgi:hypothetical protein